MINEPVIIDGVEVSCCDHYKSNGKCRIPHYQHGIKYTCCNCNEWDCYFKQLARKEQECNKLYIQLKADEEYHKEEENTLRKIIKNKEERNIELYKENNQLKVKNEKLKESLKKINDCKLEINDEITFKDLKGYICDDQVGTDELLMLMAEYFNDEEISKGLEQHCKALDETWRRVILYDSVNSSINSYIQAIKQELGRLN